MVADALGGDSEALAALAGRDADGELARRHRAGGALYLLATRQGTAAVEAWHRQLFSTAARHLQQKATVQEVASCLAPAGIDWAPLKGYDMATRLYEPEERVTGDVDLLILPEGLDEARRLLEDVGWRSLYEGPRNPVFLAEEGYAWMARKKGHPLLEVHFRLWGLVPEGFETALFERAAPDASLPPGGRRLTLADTYLVAAVHAWLSPSRPLGTWWDLARISEHLLRSEIDDVLREARFWDLQLPVALAAEVSAALWGREGCREIARQLAGDLRAPERWAASWTRRRGLNRFPLTVLQAARLTAGRRSRQGLKGPWRQIWAHPGIVERGTPATWPWFWRRLCFQVPPLRRWAQRRLPR